MGPRLAGKRALVTGAGRGIGRVTAERFAEEGAAVALADVNKEAVRAAAEKITAAGGRALAIAADVSDPESCQAMVAQAEGELGGLDVLFNNAGILADGDGGPVETPLAAWESTLAVNLTGVFLCCKHGIPALERAGGGSVINTASIVAHRGSVYAQVAYTASKGGVLAMTRELAVLYARRGIRFNAISPGVTRTEMAENLLADEAAWNLRRPFIPMGRMAAMAEIANAVVFLASDEAAFVTGQSYLVDGGVSAAYVATDDL